VRREIQRLLAVCSGCVVSLSIGLCVRTHARRASFFYRASQFHACALPSDASCRVTEMKFLSELLIMASARSGTRVEIAGTAAER
jgi:hypothetical protein